MSLKTFQNSGSINRRRMLGAMGLMGAGAALSAAPVSVTIETGNPASAATTGHEHDTTGTTTTSTANQDEMTNDEMDAMHEAGVKSFPAPTQGLGGQPLAFEMDGDVKVFNVTCKVVQWEHTPGKVVEAYTYNGVVPGPEIRITEGDKVRVVVKNDMPFSTVVHFHGVMLPNAMDGVPFITQPPIKPGETFTYEFQ